MRNHVLAFLTVVLLSLPLYMSAGPKPVRLVIVDGKECSLAIMKVIESHEIKSMKVKTKARYIQKYGEWAKEGVLFIKTHLSKSELRLRVEMLNSENQGISYLDTSRADKNFVSLQTISDSNQTRLCTGNYHQMKLLAGLLAC